MTNVGLRDPTFSELPVKITYFIENLGDYPAEVTHGRFAWTIVALGDQEPFDRFENSKVTSI